MKKVDLRKLIEEHRQCGNTTWIVNAAIDNPKCIILTYNSNSAHELKDTYKYRLSKVNVIRKMKNKKLSENSKFPIFLSKNSDLRGYSKDIPIILDNSALFE